MNEFLQMDIFFFVATIGVILLLGMAVVFGIYIIRIVRRIDRIVDLARRQTDLISEDLDDLRSGLKREGFKWSHFFRFGRNVLKRKK